MSIPEGKYLAKAGTFDFGTSKNGTEQIGVSFTISHGEYAGQSLTWYGFFNTGDNTARALKSLRASGWNTDDLLTLGGLGSVDVEIVVEHEEYEGKTQVKIAWVNSSGVAMANRMDDNARKAFAARMRGAVLATKGGGPAPANKPKPPSSSGQRPDPVDPQAGDEIPF